MVLQSKSEIFNARIEDEDIQKFKDFCFEQNISRSDLFRESAKFVIRIWPHIDKVAQFIDWLNSNTDCKENIDKLRKTDVKQDKDAPFNNKINRIMEKLIYTIS